MRISLEHRPGPGAGRSGRPPQAPGLGRLGPRPQARPDVRPRPPQAPSPLGRVQGRACSNRADNNVLLLQAPYNLRITFQSEILDATSQAAELLRILGNDISSMKCSLHTSLLKRLHSSTGRLQRSMDLHSYLLTSTHNFCDCTAKPTDKLCNALSLTLKDCSGLFTKQSSDAESNSNPAVPIQAELYHETMRKQQRRLYSWPSREVDDFEGDGGIDTDMIPRMRALESTAALSLATFTSLLIEFVARLHHLVDAVDALAKMAKFKQESAS